jgi:hypothetical protein
MIKRNVLALATILVLGALAAPADAGWRRDRSEGDVAYANSRFNNGSVSGAVRAVRYGYEVQTPSGSWIGCRTSCSETLRVSTVDLNETQGQMIGAGTLQAECGIFGCLDIGYPR